MKPEFAEVWATSILQTLPGGYLLALRDGRRSVHGMHMPTRRVVGRWRLPQQVGRTWTALAGGVSHVVITSQDEQGGNAQLWRFILPKVLRHAAALASGLLPSDSPDDAVGPNTTQQVQPLGRRLPSAVRVGRAARTARQESQNGPKR